MSLFDRFVDGGKLTAEELGGALAPMAFYPALVGSDSLSSQIQTITVPPFEESFQFRVGLFQHLEQLSPQVRAAIFGNVASIICFQVGSQDAPILAQELYRDEFNYLVTADQLQELLSYRVYLKTLIKGHSPRAVELHTYPPFPKRGGENQRTRVLNANSQRFSALEGA